MKETTIVKGTRMCVCAGKKIHGEIEFSQASVFVVDWYDQNIVLPVEFTLWHFAYYVLHFSTNLQKFSSSG